MNISPDRPVFIIGAILCLLVVVSILLYEKDPFGPYRGQVVRTVRDIIKEYERLKRQHWIDGYTIEFVYPILRKVPSDAVVMWTRVRIERNSRIIIERIIGLPDDTSPLVEALVDECRRRRISSYAKLVSEQTRDKEFSA